MIKVVLCTYNGEKFIEEQLNSILSQTLQVDTIEIFDDCSVDNTMEKIKRIVDKFKNEKVKFIVNINSKNKGYIENFSHAIKNCTPKDEFVFLCDQDDVWEPDKVKVMVAKLKEYKNTPSLVFSDAKLIDALGNHLNNKLWNSINFNILKDADYELTRRNVVTGATAALNYALVEVFKHTQISKFLPHDYCLAVLASSYGSLIPIEDELTRYRLHGNNQIGTSASFLERAKKVLFDRKGATLKSEIGKFSELMEITKIQDPVKYAAFREKWKLYCLLFKHNCLLSPIILIKHKVSFKAAVKLMQMSIMRYLR